VKTLTKFLVILTFQLLYSGALAEDYPPMSPSALIPAPAPSPSGPSVPRSKDINFDDELVEGMNQNPFDSLTHLGKKEDRGQAHLYRKKASFKREISETAQEMGYTQ